MTDIIIILAYLLGVFTGYVISRAKSETGLK